MQTSSPESDQKIWEHNEDKKKGDLLHTQHVTVDWGDAAAVTDVFGLDVDAADQFCILPVVEGQTIPGFHPQ